MMRDRFALALAATAVLAIGVLALCWPVKLDEYDRWGMRIGCGTGFASSYDQASLSDQEPPPFPQPQSGYLQDCQSAILWRRGWASAAVLLGAGTGMALVLNRQRRPAETQRIKSE